MSSPFVSVSRRRKRSAASNRLTFVGVIAVVALLGMVVPALGGPRALAAASPVSIAKKALKLAKKANKKSTKALLRASRGPADESITSAKIANLTIKNEDISPGAVGSGKIANGAIHNEDIAPGAVGGGKIANGSVTTADLAGADISGSISESAGAIGAHQCLTRSVSLGGARVGDVALLTFTGNVPVPGGLTFQILKVTAPDLGTLRYCNPTGSPSPAFTNVGVRVIAFH